MSSRACRLAVVDYGMGNLHSVTRQLGSDGVEIFIASAPEDLARADKIILPGVGHFAKAMANLAELGLVSALEDAVRVHCKPVLGICLGMQLLAKHSEEGEAGGLGWIDARVRRFRVSDPSSYKIPHTGWNTVKISRSTDLFRGVADKSEFYFVHAYYVEVAEDAVAIGWTRYEETFASAVQKDNIYGVQFHPEKSFESGGRLLRNFLTL